MKATRFITLTMILGAAACGSGQKTQSGLGSGATPPPPPRVADAKPDDPGAPKRQLSKDAKGDYQAALDFYLAQEKGGWNESGCKQAAEKFGAVSREHKLVEAQYMVGRSLHNCSLLGDAEKAYQTAIGMKSNHAQSISNLGEIYYRDGKVGPAKDYWQNAIKANPKLIAARNNLASLQLEEMRKPDIDAAKWTQLEADARSNLSNALAVDNDNVKSYVLYGLVYMEGRQKNKNRLDLAKLLLDEGAKRTDKYAPLENARGLYFLYRNNLSEALAHFSKAVELDPKFAEARMNVGLITLGFRKYDAAREQFQKVLEIQPKNYDAVIGMGIAARGMNDLDAAEAAYKKAKDLDGSRGDAFYNLGVLYKDFKAAKQADLKASQEAYRTARGYFQQFGEKKGSDADKQEAKDNIADCDKVIKQLD